LLSYRATHSVTSQNTLNTVIFLINVIIQGVFAPQTPAVICRTTYTTNITESDNTAKGKGKGTESRSQSPRGLKRGSVAARLLGLRVRIPPGGMDVCLLRLLCVLSLSSVRRADHSSRGIVPSVVSLSVPEPTRNVEPQKEVKKTAPAHAMKRYGEWPYNSTHFTTALDGKGWSASGSNCFNHGERSPGNH
jgi:hypothetical protein